MLLGKGDAEETDVDATGAVDLIGPLLLLLEEEEEVVESAREVEAKAG